MDSGVMSMSAVAVACAFELGRRESSRRWFWVERLDQQRLSPGCYPV